MATIGDRLHRLSAKQLWDVDLSSVDKRRKVLISALRLTYVVVRELAEGQLTLRAMSLVYTTLLSFVPLLAVSFSVLKAFGVHNQVKPALDNFLAPLGPKGMEVSRNIIEFVDNVKVGVLGSIGLVLLIYTVIALIQKIEGAFNFIWRIKRTRSFAQAFRDYLSVILVGPVLVFTALGITATIMNTTVVQALLSIEPFGTAAYVIGRLVPYILVCAAFTFIYVFIPNTKVKFGSALVGGVFAGILWEATGWAFASFIVTSTKYEAIYSGFAILIMFMIWVYVSWLILLVGAQVAFYYQHPQLVTATKIPRQLSNRSKERLGLMIIFLIVQNYHHNKSHWTLSTLVNRLGIDGDSIQDMLDLLQDKGLVVQTADDPPGYLPERDIETISIEEVYQATRTEIGATSPSKGGLLDSSPVSKVMDRIDRSVGTALGQKMMKDLVHSQSEWSVPQVKRKKKN